MPSTTSGLRNSSCALLLMMNMFGASASFNVTISTGILHEKANWDWVFRLCQSADVCDEASAASVKGNGNFGCSKIELGLTWRSFPVIKGDLHAIVLFRGAGCPYTEDVPFHYDCRTDICNLAFGDDVPSSYLVTSRGQGTCND